MAAKLTIHGKLELSNGDVIDVPFSAVFQDEEEAVDQYWAAVRGAFGAAEAEERSTREQRVEKRGGPKR